MKISEFKSFRDFDRKFVKITNVNNKDKVRLKLDNLKEPWYGILYIDEECGISLRVLGNEDNFIKDKGILLRADVFDDIDFEIFDGTNELKNVLDNQINKYYYSDKYEELLSDKKLDKFRHEFFPNDVKTLLILDNQLEQMWVRLTMKTDQKDLYVGKLLNTSYYKKKEYYQGQDVAIKYYKNENNEELIIQGKVKFVD